MHLLSGSIFPVIAIITQLIFLEGILSIDNAAVLGALVAPLSDHELIPWPAFLEKPGSLLNPLLGFQRSAALKVGLLGAYLGRGTMLLLASYLIHNSWIRLVGAAYLIHLAFDELGDTTPDNETEEEKLAKRTSSFWGIVLTVEIMDLIFSIDNVIAAVSLSNELWVVLVGVAIGILTMRFAAGIFSYAVEREPALKYAAYVLVLNIGIQLILEQVWKIEIADGVRFGISISIIALTVIYARLKFLHRFQFIFNWLSRGMGLVNEMVSWVFAPFTSLFGLIFKHTPNQDSA